MTKTNSLVDALNSVLATVLDLKLRTKQAHWNVKGPNFIAVHELFDKLAGEHDAIADDIAERVAQLDGFPLGTTEYITKKTVLKTYDARLQKSADVLYAINTSIIDAAKLTKATINKAEDVDDPVTADLLTQVTSILEKQKWFVSSHIE